MKSILAISAVFALIGLCTCSTPKQRTGVLELQAVNSELHISRKKDSKQGPCIKSCGDITYKLVNNADHNIMLYNFKRYFQFGLYEEGLKCDTLWNDLGKALYLMNDSLDFVAPSFTVHDTTNSSPEAMKRHFAMAKTWFRNSRVTVKSGETLEFTQSIDFRDYELHSGIYYIKLLYMQASVPPEITPDEIESDLKENDAYLFKGCLWSNTVKLVVE